MEHEDIPSLEEAEAVDVVALEAGSGGSDDSDDDFDEEVSDNGELTKCLFCAEVLPSIETAMEHLEDTHKIRFARLKSRFHMDQYSFIKLINCIRRDSVSAEKLAAAEQPFWLHEKYLKPKEYESWLSYDYEELLVEDDNTKDSQNGDSLEVQVRILQEKLNTQTLQLEQAIEDMAKMRSAFQRLVESTSNGKASLPQQSGRDRLKTDESYFSGYAHFGIHHEMLSDVVRTTSYRDALLKNREFVSGKDVLDVGCGTGILSVFASQAGANKVVAIDNSDIIYNAMDIVKRNQVENVTLLKGRLEDTDLPQKQFDIIISEWMGYFLLFEGMLDSVIYARDHHLKPGGMLLPNRCTMSLLGYGSDSLFEQHVSFWNDVYGLDMRNMRQEVMHEPLIELVDPEHILTEPNTIADLHLTKVDLNYSNFTYDFRLKCTKDGSLSAFVGYFDTFFDLPEPVRFSTGPTEKPTHWKQVVFFIEQPHRVNRGDIVSGQLRCKRHPNNARSLDISIQAFGRECTYYLD